MPVDPGGRRSERALNLGLCLGCAWKETHSWHWPEPGNHAVRGRHGCHLAPGEHREITSPPPPGTLAGTARERSAVQCDRAMLVRLPSPAVDHSITSSTASESTDCYASLREANSAG